LAKKSCIKRSFIFILFGKYEFRIIESEGWDRQDMQHAWESEKNIKQTT
jgi:hypothetical protein